MIWKTNEFAVFLALLIGFVLIMEAAFRLGRHYSAQSGDRELPHVGALQGALLGLLALLLGFTFAMAVQRFDTRRALVLEESNAIGTASLRAQFLPEAERREAAQLFKEYVRARLDFYNAVIDEARLEAAFSQAARIQERLWALSVGAIVQDQDSESTALFVESLNDVIDVSEARRVAMENHVPETVLLLLFAVAAVSLMFVAYGSGLSGRRRVGANFSLALLITLVLIIIIDIDRPARGLIKVSQDTMIRLQQDLEQRTP